ncbi:MAG TPA: hypothetical protein PK110_15865 [Niabella sp.]|nr:hypothetical protein [Niabella sp.]
MAKLHDLNLSDNMGLFGWILFDREKWGMAYNVRQIGEEADF